MTNTRLPQLVGVTPFTGIWTDWAHPAHFDLPIPAGTEFGDLLIASIYTYDSSTLVAPGRGLAELYRFDAVADDSYGVWAGPWDGDETPIAWQGSGFLNSTGQYFAAFLATYRGRLDPTRPLVKADAVAPGLPGEGPALCINWLFTGFGGVGSIHPFDGTTWTESVRVDATYKLGTIGINTGVIVDEPSLDPYPFPYMSFGILDVFGEPPCRLTGREDSLGVGSGRIWPPAKSQQASPRRAGGYY